MLRKNGAGDALCSIPVVGMIACRGMQGRLEMEVVRGISYRDSTQHHRIPRCREHSRGGKRSIDKKYADSKDVQAVISVASYRM
jgi:hypothetical protein